MVLKSSGLTIYNLKDLQHSVNGWIDWNLMLDTTGGPNYVNNTVDAAMIVDTGLIFRKSNKTIYDLHI